MFRYCISLVSLHSRCPRCAFALGHYSRVLWSFFQGSRVVHVVIFRLDTAAVSHFLPPVLFLATGETSHHLCPFSDHLWWLRLIFLLWLFQVTLNMCIGYHILKAAWNKAPKIEYDWNNPVLSDPANCDQEIAFISTRWQQHLPHYPFILISKV